MATATDQMLTSGVPASNNQASPPRSVLANLLSPSLSDVLFVSIIAVSFLSGAEGWLRLFGDGDAGFHIRVGDWILKNGVPSQHPFSFSVTGKEWFAFEWLTQTAMAMVHGWWGLKGIAVMFGTIIAATFALLFRYSLARGANPLIAIVLVLLAANVNNVHYHARPHIITWLLLVIAIWITDSDRRNPSRRIWWLVPLTALWANHHGGFVVFFILLALMVAGLIAEAFFDPALRVERIAAVRRYVAVGACCAAASLANPYGFHLHAHVFEVLNAKWLTEMIHEFQSPSFRGEAMTAFMGLLFCGVACVGSLIRRRRTSEALWILFLAYSSLVSVRHATIYVLVAIPIIATEASVIWRRLVDQSARASAWRVLDGIAASMAAGAVRTSLVPLFFVLALPLLPWTVFPSDFPSERFPAALAGRHRELATARVFTTDQWSDYLVYRYFPVQKVFIDGQHQYYGEKHVKDYVSTLQAQAAWPRLLDKFQISHVLCPADGPLAAAMQADSGWRLIDKGESALLFARANAR